MTQLAADPVPTTTITRTGTWWGRRPWLGMFLGGLGLWLATVVVTFATQNVNLVPTIILLGSFLVPVTFVAYAFGHGDEVVTAQRILTAFVYGGVLGVLGASVLEAEFLKQPWIGTYLGVGLIEEAVKLAALWLLAWRLPRYTMRDGIVLGAAVGFGFAALESAGYAFNALFTKMQPAWAPKAIATAFLLIALFIFWAAERRASAVLNRLRTHEVKTLRIRNLRLISAAVMVATAALIGPPPS